MKTFNCNDCVKTDCAQPDNVRVERSSSCFPRKLVSFVRPRELGPDYMRQAGPVKRVELFLRDPGRPNEICKHLARDYD